jgi:hypothetical protein
MMQSGLAVFLPSDINMDDRLLRRTFVRHEHR